MFSNQGFKIAFVGMNTKAQFAFAEYLKRSLDFKRMDFEDPLIRFLRIVYQYKQTKRIDQKKVRDIYDAIYKIDNEFFINFLEKRIQESRSDIIVPNVRYLNELERLRQMDFKIVRVTSNATDKPRVGDYVRKADAGTVYLSMLYDKRFAQNYNVDYSIHFTSLPTRKGIMDALLQSLGYKFDNTP